ncbi:MAG TPA: hypothetical protein VH143_27330 [Kofleriaceae bacterium]|jgi:hypothetical protein|nr:hypothetical protein [Kofleriaceae bacterium]
MAPRSRAVAFVRAAAPWVVGIALVIVVARRLPMAAFRRGLHEGPQVTLAIVDTAVTLAMLLSDSFATWLGLAAVRIRIGLGKVTMLRGATYMLALLNYAAAQGGLGYFLHRSGIGGMRAASATLFLVGTTFATLLGVTTAAWASSSGPVPDLALWHMLLATCAAFAVYLVVIAARPSFLTRWKLLESLFDAGIGGHAVAIAARIPHVLVIVLGHWFAMRVWGIPVPFVVAATIMPAVVIAALLPTPGGLGTTQVALVYFFARYASGATSDDREAAVLAFSIVHFVYGVLSQLAVGVACIPFARRLTADQGRPTSTVSSAN